MRPQPPPWQAALNRDRRCRGRVSGLWPSPLPPHQPGAIAGSAPRRLYPQLLPVAPPRPRDHAAAAYRAGERGLRPQWKLASGWVRAARRTAQQKGRLQAGSTARLPASAWGRAERPGSAATGTGVPAGMVRSWRAGPMAASGQQPAQRRRSPARVRVRAALRRESARQRLRRTLTRGMAPARKLQPALAPDRAAAGSCMRAAPIRRPPRHSRMRRPCRRHGGRFWRRIRARTGYPRVLCDSNRAGVVKENCGKTKLPFGAGVMSDLR